VEQEEPEPLDPAERLRELQQEMLDVIAAIEKEAAAFRPIAA
jgi:hypothetical protein